MIDFTIPYTLTTPQGTLLFNEATGSPYTSNMNYLFLLDETQCSETPGPLRITQDNQPQADGWIIHPSFLQGMQLKLGVQLWVQNGDDADTRAPACDADLCVMWDTLLLHAKAMQSPALSDLVGGNCRLVYDPACGAERMLDRLQLIEWPTFTKPGLVTAVSLGLATNYPYELDHSEDTPNTIADGATETLVNNGTAGMFPVYRVHGPFSIFTILNQTTGEYITYNSGFPGANDVLGGHYIEIDTFRNTVYLDGNSADYMAGVDLQLSDFFPLVPGANDIQFGAGGSGSLDVLWQSAWAN